MEKNIIPFKYVRGHLTYVTYDMFYRIISYSLYDIDCMSDVWIDSTCDFCPSSFFWIDSELMSRSCVRVWTHVSKFCPCLNSWLEVVSVSEFMSRSCVRVRTHVPNSCPEVFASEDLFHLWWLHLNQTTRTWLSKIQNPKIRLGYEIRIKSPNFDILNLKFKT